MLRFKHTYIHKVYTYTQYACIFAIHVHTSANILTQKLTFIDSAHDSIVLLSPCIYVQPN